MTCRNLAIRCALNALLAAEYSAITAYTAGAGLIGDAPDTDPLFGLADVIVKIAVDIQSQHKLHAEALVEALEALGGTPVVEADIDVVPEAFVAQVGDAPGLETAPADYFA